MVLFRLISPIGLQHERVGMRLLRALLDLSEVKTKTIEGQKLTVLGRPGTSGRKKLYASSTVIWKIVALPPLPISVLLVIGRIS